MGQGAAAAQEMKLPLRTSCLLFFGTALIATTAFRVWRLDHPPSRPHPAIASVHANDVIELRGLDGHTITVSFAGPRQKLLHVWASWCSPCVAELPLFAAVAPELRQRGIDLILVALGAVELLAWVEGAGTRTTASATSR
jgi:thiol-disulfide isomerase/thioredoxin